MNGLVVGPLLVGAWGPGPLGPPLNPALVHTAWKKARDRDTWHQVVSTATLC